MKSLWFLGLLGCFTGCASIPQNLPSASPYNYRPIALDNFTFAFPQTKQTLLVAVIDTGANLQNSPSLKNRIFYDTTGSYGWDNVKNSASPVDISESQHGTLVAQIIAEHLDALKVPNVKLMPIRYTAAHAQSKNEHTSYSLAKGIDFAIRHKAKIINISSSGEEPNPMEKALIEKANDAGILVVVAAGNENSPSAQAFPCAYRLPNLICVGNGDTQGKRPSSNFGPEVDVMINGQVKGLRYGWKIEGTSFSAPQITAAAAFWWRKHPQATPAQIRAKILKSVDTNKSFSWIKFVDAYRGLAIIKQP